MHSCVGRIRYLGVLLYDADRIEQVAACSDKELVKSQLDLYLDPHDPEVTTAAKKSGIADSTLDAARKSPVWKFVREWGLALPIHPEFRTIPNLFYVPPLLPVMATVDNNRYDTTSESLWGKIEDARLPLKYMANLFSAGDTAVIYRTLKKLMAVRIHRRSVTVGDIKRETADQSLLECELSPDVADAIFRMTSLAHFSDRFVIPPAHREEAIEMIQDTHTKRGHAGFGFIEKPERGL
jgi:nitrate reductase beta subunit